MSLDETKFSHITVTSDDEDDVVIHAGAPVKPAPQVPVESTPAPAAEESPAPQQEPAQPTKKKSRRSDDYRPTTAEDLASAPMSTTQKVVIAVAVVLFIAVVVWLVTH